jgi:hypothetical protein
LGNLQVHFHMVNTPRACSFPPRQATQLTRPQIPKPTEEEGLGIIWKTQSPDMDKLKALHEEIKSKM